MFSAVVVPSGLPTHSVGGLPLCTSSAACVFGWLLMRTLPTGVRWGLVALVMCLSRIVRDAEHFFHVLVLHLCTFLGETSPQVSCP